ncbi:MAG: type II secretion system protein [Terrimicrobiaceae bacterium]
MERFRSAFSLIETLVAVGVIITLAALTLGVWSRISGKLLATRALNNLRQIGVASSVYAGEHDGSFPGSAHSADSWVAGLLPYVGLDANSSPDRIKKAYRSPGDPNKTRLYSYAINDYLLPNPAGAKNLNFSRAGSLTSPSQTLLFSETQKSYTGSDHFHFAYGYAPSVFLSMVAADRYSGEGIYLFADFHVEKLQWTDVQQRLTAAGSRLIHPGGNP